MMIKKTWLYGALVLILIIAGAFFVLKAPEKSNGKVVESDKSPQEIIISFKNYNYYPNTIKVEAEKPVRIYLDSSVSGCYRGFTIRELGISKYLQTPKDYIEFIPSKKGTYKFACSMGMGTGTLIVE